MGLFESSRGDAFFHRRFLGSIRQSRRLSYPGGFAVCGRAATYIRPKVPITCRCRGTTAPVGSCGVHLQCAIVLMGRAHRTQGVALWQRRRRARKAHRNRRACEPRLEHRDFDVAKRPDRCSAVCLSCSRYHYWNYCICCPDLDGRGLKKRVCQSGSETSALKAAIEEFGIINPEHQNRLFVRRVPSDEDLDR